MNPDKFKIHTIGCGGRTRTSDLWVMSPTSCQLLYPAILVLFFTTQLYYTIWNIMSIVWQIFIKLFLLFFNKYKKCFNYIFFFILINVLPFATFITNLNQEQSYKFKIILPLCFIKINSLNFWFNNHPTLTNLLFN